VELTIRIVFSLLVVVALMWGLAKLARKPLGLRKGGMIDVLGRQQLSRGAAVAVVRVADRAMVLGITDGQVTLLTEADLDTLEEYQHDDQVRRESISLESLGSGPLEGLGSARTPTAPVVSSKGPLSGSILSARTFTQTWDALRERMVRRP
jgi:flagellar protein FliO/FliZ